MTLVGPPEGVLLQHLATSQPIITKMDSCTAAQLLKLHQTLFFPTHNMEKTLWPCRNLGGGAQPRWLSLSILC